MTQGVAVLSGCVVPGQTGTDSEELDAILRSCILQHIVIVIATAAKQQQEAEEEEWITLSHRKH